ncbi:MAG: ferritin-like domain-containing protein [Flavisolibacter sp.]|nr:ferritin-like domain-containing protein [Flavisolibacter sp.]
MNDLKDLLRHDVQDLYSAEEQIIAAMPRMIEKANNPQLKEALQQHLQITEEQRRRLEQVQQLLAGGEQEGGQGQGEQGGEGGERPGLMARLFRRRSEGDGQMCRGMQGIIEEGERVMGEEMNQEVLDAAIIGCAQKVEHYEICGYGTARAFARELNLGEVARLLEQTLNEEYEADDRLTQMALGGVNQEAENARGSARRSSGGGRGASASRGGASKGASKGSSKGASKSASKGSSKSSGGGGSKSASKGGSKAASKGSSKGGSKAASKSSGGRGGSKGSSKAASKGLRRR